MPAPTTLSFPNAKGAGAYSRADVTYTHRIVTNLNDSGAGSFRDACQPNSIISFNVSGISINTNLTYAGLQNVIILGQTAPEGGFDYGGPGLRAEYAENLIIRYISFKNEWFGRDAVDFIGCENAIIDHCSISFGGDETMSFRASYSDTIARNITVSNNHLNYGKTGMLLGDSGDLTKNDTFSCIGNMWSLISHRHPNVNGNTRIDVIGNVVYDHSSRIMVTAGDLELNDINNSHISFDTNTAKHQSRIVGYDPLIYSEGNYNLDLNVVDGTSDNWQLWRNRIYTSGETEIDPLPLQYRTNTIFPLINFNSSELEDAAWWRDKALVQKDVGNCARLDVNGNKVQQIQPIDQSVYDRIDNSTAFPWTGALDYKVMPELLDWKDNTYPNQGGVVLNTHSPSTHTATVSNAWITANGMTPATFDPMGNDLHSTYTNIEMYSFEIDGIVSSQKPIISLVGASTIELEVGNSYVELGATATDVEDGDLTSSIVIDSSAVDINTAGSYQVTYNVTDSDSNAAVQVVRVVNVVTTSTVTYPLTPIQIRTNKEILTSIIK